MGWKLISQVCGITGHNMSVEFRVKLEIQSSDSEFGADDT